MLKFIKMQALGNDYIYIDQMEEEKPLDFCELSKRLCKRHFGVGADGIIVIKKSPTCTAKMLIFNSDGSPATMCGNATRCVAFYLFKKLGKRELVIETPQKKVWCKICRESENCAYVLVNFGKVKFFSKEQNVVDCGNLHKIIEVENFDFCLEKVGEKICKKNDNKYNIDFVKKVDKNKIFIKVFERGSGATFSCGSGAVASAYFVHKSQKINKIKVKQNGGDMLIFFKNNDTYMLGKAQFVFWGELKIE